MAELRHLITFAVRGWRQNKTKQVVPLMLHQLLRHFLSAIPLLVHLCQPVLIIACSIQLKLGSSRQPFLVRGGVAGRSLFLVPSRPPFDIGSDRCAVPVVTVHALRPARRCVENWTGRNTPKSH